MSKDNLATHIRSFFEQYLVSQRGLSSHTILAYRDTMKLLLGFAGHGRKSPASLTLKDLSADMVRRFLDHLERSRKNSVSTRNQRLAAIHSFFQYLAIVDPRYIAHTKSIIAVPFKRRDHRAPEYLEREEIQAIFAQINGRTIWGQRDDALLRLLYNTGMRVQELVNLDVSHLRLSRPYNVRIFGKGRKERTCPLWKETVGALKIYLEARSIRSNEAIPLFVNAEGNRLTRFGVRYIITRRVADAAKICPTLLTRNVTPHTFRHTTAMHLLQSNVDLSMIRSWLGHASIQTTHGYVEINLEMKRKALQSCKKLIPTKRQSQPSWKKSPDILSWLSEL
ncbi:MAG: site-specific integrase [Limisphaerales bacterium]